MLDFPALEIASFVCGNLTGAGITVWYLNRRTKKKMDEMFDMEVDLE